MKNEQFGFINIIDEHHKQSRKQIPCIVIASQLIKAKIYWQALKGEFRHLEDQNIVISNDLILVEQKFYRFI